MTLSLFVIVLGVAVGNFGQSVFTPTWTCLNGDSAASCNNMVNLPVEYPTSTSEGYPGSRSMIGGAWQSPTQPDIHWLLGGWDSFQLGAGQAYGDFWSFNATDGQWRSHGAQAMNVDVQYSANPNEPSASNYPGTRVNSMCYLYNEQLILIGGMAVISGILGNSNDIWSYDENTTFWNWLGGPNTLNDPGSTGMYQQFAPSNRPSGRRWSATWQLSTTPELLWLQGGLGDSGNSWGDMWVLNISSLEWAWMNGITIGCPPPQYPPEEEYIGARMRHSAWVGPDQLSVYIFGGSPQYLPTTSYNDLWQYSFTTGNWSFLAGCQGADNETCCAGTASYPSCRGSVVMFASPYGLWLFGGGYDVDGAYRLNNDLWAINVTSGIGTSYAVVPLGAADVGLLQSSPYGIFYGGDVLGGGPHSGYWNNYASSALWSVKVCIGGCLECDGLGAPTCQVCDVGHVLEPSTGLCLNECPSGQYDAGGTCADCTTGCILCTGPGTSIPPCSACDVNNGYVELANETACVPYCPTGQFKGTSQCIPCTTGCSVCSSAGLLYPAPCSECDVAGGYYLNEAKTACIQGCPVGQYNLAGQCKACEKGCESCTAYGLTIPPCTQCNTSLGFVENSAGQACVSVCPVGQYKGSSACTECTFGCIDCTGAGLVVPSQCTACNTSAGFLLDTAGNACVEGCRTGAFNKSGQCSACEYGCSSCSGYGLASPVCTACNASAGFFLETASGASICVSSCSDGQYKGATSCEPCTNGCENCTAAGLLMPASCQACNLTAGFFPNQDETECVSSCPVGQFQLGFACINCSVGCAACSGVGLEYPNQCFACDGAAGFALNTTDATCQLGCPGAQFVAPSGNCTACTVGCALCVAEGLSTPIECLKCDVSAGFVANSDESLCVPASPPPTPLNSVCSTFQRRVGASCELNTPLLAGIVGGGAAVLCGICFCILWRAQRRDKLSEEGRPLLDVAAGHRYSTNNTTMQAMFMTRNSDAAYNTTQSAFTIAVEGVNLVRPDELDMLGELGAGGFGTVYRVRHRKTYTEMALKLFTASDSAQAESFVREATVMANLHHPSCLRCLGICLDPLRPTTLGLLVEFMPGGDLEHRKNQQLTLSDVIAILMKVLQGLMYLHGKDLVHRDLKPGNILLDGRGGVVVADFGLVNFRGNAFTPYYAAPEVKAGGEPTSAADVYALGLIGLELLECVDYSNSTSGDAAKRIDVRLKEAMQQACSERARDRPPCEQLLALVVELSESS